METDEIIHWLRIGALSFIIAFIITITLGIITAIILAESGTNYFFIIGGIPLAWFKTILGVLVYDTGALVLDLLFWTFIVFLIITRKKDPSKEKLINRINVKGISMDVGFSLVLGLVIILLTAGIGYMIASEPFNADSQYFQQSTLQMGAPYYWLNFSRQFTRGEYSIEEVYISSYDNMIADFLLFSFIFFMIITIVLLAIGKNPFIMKIDKKNKIIKEKNSNVEKEEE